MSPWLLDTCVIIDYLRDRREAVDFMDRLGTPPFLSVVTVAELFAGARSVVERHGFAAMPSDADHRRDCCLGASRSRH